MVFLPNIALAKNEQPKSFYQKALAKNEQPKSHKEMKVHFELYEEKELPLIQSVYERLATDEMMLRCLRGKTQNPNESFHSRIWRYCPKNKNTKTKTSLDFAVAQALANSNSGYVASDLNILLGVPYT